MRGPLPVLVLLLAAGLAGCSGEPVHTEPGTVLPEEGTHLFEHAGGVLTFTLAEGANVTWDLYTPDDARLAAFRLDAAHSELEVELPAGTWAIRIHPGEGVAQVDAPLSFAPAVAHVERHVLVQRPHDDVPRLPLVPLGSDRVDLDVRMELVRAPQELRLLASGSHEALEVVVRGGHGPLLESYSGGTLDLAGAFGEPGLLPLPATFHAANVAGREVTASVRADHLEGVLVLEAWSYSRAPAPVPGADADGGSKAPVFLYGQLEERPVWFEVHPEAGHLVATAPEGARLAVWGPDGLRHAVVEVPQNGSARIAVEGGRYAAMAWGTVTLGAPRAPSDLELHPLEVREERFAGPEGSGPYTSVTQTVGAEGILYEVRVHGDFADFQGVLGACTRALVRVLQGPPERPDVVAVNLPDEGLAGARLVDGTATVTMEGAAECLRGGYEARSFVLP